MNKSGKAVSAFGIAVNFLLFLVKLYVSISSNSLSVYCDSINNLLDSVSCILAFVCFFLSAKYSEKKSCKVQSLSSFVINCIIVVTGIYFIYNGIERLMYPVQVSYSVRYAVLLFITVFIKLMLAFVYRFADKKSPSPVIKALTLDSFLDCAVTLTALIGFVVVGKINYALDGIFAVLLGIIVAVLALKSVICEARFLVSE
ncbi:MAG: cation transporter [Clostridiales bacterium]|nr:cation transporter [Clostridiales bacterium]